MKELWGISDCGEEYLFYVVQTILRALFFWCCMSRGFLKGNIFVLSVILGCVSCGSGSNSGSPSNNNTNTSRYINSSLVPELEAVVYFPFDGLTTDGSPNNLNADAYDTEYTTDKDGATAKAIEFKGLPNSYVDVPDNDLLDLPRSFSIAAWVNPDQNDSFMSLVAKNEGVEWTGVFFETYSMILDEHYLAVPLGGALLVSPLSEVPANEWTHVAVTWDTENLHFYINGTRTESRIILDLPFEDTEGSLSIGGGSKSSSPFKGKMDEVYVFSRALTENEIDIIYGL